MRKYKVSFFVMLIGIPSASLFTDTLLPYFLSQAVGTLSGGTIEQITQFLWLAAGVAIVGVCLNLLGFQSAIMHESSVRRDLADDTVDRLIAKDQAFFANQDNCHAFLQLFQTVLFLRIFAFVLEFVSKALFAYRSKIIPLDV